MSRTKRHKARQTRREMFRSVARYGALAGLGVLSAGLLVRRAGSGAEGRCPTAASCRGCGALARCMLPQAVRTKGLSER